MAQDHCNLSYPPDLLMARTRERTLSENGLHDTENITALQPPPQSKSHSLTLTLKAK